jgi:hypothetical protein
MSDSKNQNRYTGADRRTAHAESNGVKPSAAPAVQDVYKTGGRHSAITNNLYNWHSYKSWADKMRGTWEEKK